MFEFEDITMENEGLIEYYWYDLLRPGKWNIRDESNFKLAVL